MRTEKSPLGRLTRGSAPLATKIVSAILLALALLLGSWAGGHSTSGEASVADVLTAAVTELVHDAAPLSDTPPGITSADAASVMTAGALCVFGLLCGALFFLVLRRARWLRLQRVLARAAVVFQHSWPRTRFFAPQLTLSQLAILRT